MSTLGELIEFVRHQLSGLDATTDAVAALTGAATATNLVLHLDSTATGASRGIAEIDLEVVRIAAVNSQDASVSLYPFGRGYRGTLPVAHAIGAEVRFAPAWPASTIAREINGVLTEIYPTIWGIQAVETTFPTYGAAIPVLAGSVGIISVWVADTTLTGWARQDAWDYAPDGLGVRVGNPRPGERVRIVYAIRPKVFNLTSPLTQDYASTTGLDARTADLLALGVAARLAIFMDVGKLPFVVAAAADANAERQPGGGGSAAKTLHALFQARLAQEAAVLTREHPVRVHRIR
jgi:hypothetical protein